MTDGADVADDAGDESTIQIELRSPDEVFARVVLLATVLRRLFLESEYADETGDPEVERFDLATWIRTEGIDRIATESEMALLDTPLGRIGEDAVDAVDASGAGLVALAWAVGIVDALAPPEQPFDATPVLAALPEPWDRVAATEQLGGMRVEKDVWREQERADVWHWRATVELDRRAAGADAALALAAIAEVATDANRAGLIGRPLDGDFPVRGHPFHQLREDEVEFLATVSRNRLRALNWLCGFGSSWHDVPLDV